MPDINPITQMNHVDKILQKASESHKSYLKPKKVFLHR